MSKKIIGLRTINYFYFYLYPLYHLSFLVTLNVLDLILMLPLAWGLFKGFKKGLIYELAILMALILGVMGAFRFSTLAGKYLSVWFEITWVWLPYLSFLVVFILIIILIIFFAKLLELMLKITMLNVFNKLAGAVFGLLKWALILSIILYLFEPLNNQYDFLSQERLADSRLYKPLSDFSLWIIPSLHEWNEGWDILHSSH